MASITTRTVKVFDVPRRLLPEFLKMPESRQVCVYYLVSDDAEGGTSQCYIGRSEELPASGCGITSRRRVLGSGPGCGVADQ